LIRKRPDGLQRYFRELSQLPRDLALDEDTLWQVFARSFGAVDMSGQPDLNALRELADEWDRDVQIDKYDPRELELMRTIRLAFRQAAMQATAPIVAGGTGQPGTTPATAAGQAIPPNFGGIRRPR
jgi:hypothetical protein